MIQPSRHQELNTAAVPTGMRTQLRDASAALVGGYAALRVAQWRGAGRVVRVFILATAIWNLSQLTQPLWLQLLSVVAPVAGAWLAERHYRRAQPGDPLLN